jgi:hypothetical protein
MAAITNFYVDTGSNFGAVITVIGSDGLPLDLTGFTCRSYIRKSYISPNHIDFHAEIYSAVGGQVRVSLSNTDTANIKPGRYMYDVYVTSPSSESLRVSEGIIIFTPQMTGLDPVDPYPVGNE